MSRDAHRALLRSLVARHPGLIILESRSERWASATFTGARHVLTCAIGPDLTGIEEATFELPGHFVADLAVERRANHILIEALTVESV